MRDPYIWYTLDDLPSLTEGAKRIADREGIEKLIYEVFYGGPLAFAKRNLAEAIQRHCWGLPRLSREEEQREYLAALSAEERAEWWKRENARRKLEGV